MAADNRLPLDMSGKQTRARKVFVFHGRRYVAGDRFPWRQLSCSVRKARQLHDDRFITSGDFLPDVTEPKQEVAQPLAEPKKEAAKPKE
jgi:hypothetical protein